MSHSQQQDDNDLKSIPRKAIASYESKYKYLSIRKILPEGIALVTINREEQLNALNLVGHWELKEIFVDLDQDDEVKVIVVTGKGKAFCAGGDLEMTLRMTKDEVYMRQVETDARAIVNNVLNCTKVVISAINGICVGAGKLCAILVCFFFICHVTTNINKGTVVALMADISVTYADCVIKDGHINLGVAAGDHACFSWPLNVGLAKSKYYLLLDEPIKGAEAERIGLVSKVVEKDNVLSFSLESKSFIKKKRPCGN